ncbi:MAG TPA: GntR family transcriptional regulator [Casimicrobiaceae bacterium]|nr:GntR family transcriptional regulator [Casimicrobiaceae bacterium]
MVRTPRPSPGRLARPADRSADFFNPFPRYLQIRNILVRRLGDGFAAGDRFPTEHALCSEFGVSRETIREALLGLENEGLIARFRGKGTVVVKLPGHSRDERLTGLVEDFTELGLDTHAEVIKAGAEAAPGRIASALGLKRGTELFRIVRLRRVDGKPFAFHDAFVPVDIGTQLAKRDLTHTTLFAELARMPGVKLSEVYQHIDAVAADVGMAKQLAIDVGAPLLVTRRAVDHKRSGAPTMFFETCFRADRYYYSVQVDEARVPARGARKANGATKHSTASRAASKSSKRRGVK